ncbi:hypothetical protein [Herbaspirillum frisingense]|uniref:DUF3224 domain-containing protein n=1 Tax=Herbaspirillum frisingense TaxID=92645 RepID=A0ABU1PC94_9BURK|nr:hypothetical protein [Herbaspirillum frisingense]MDR6583553.1 hypothetical protein [Herbaspirillum frisingense]
MSAGEMYFQALEPQEWYSADAVIYRAVKSEGSVNLLYRGKIVDSGYTFEGKLTLQLTLSPQSIKAVYSGKYADGSVDTNKNFELVGRFRDTSFTSFEGKWTEIIEGSIADYDFFIEELAFGE